jgi:superfamily II DNA or RNA helicase
MLPHQRRASAAIQEHKCLLLFLKPGGGKTVATLDALVALGPDAFPVLVLAPVRVCETVWGQETQAWEHLRHLRTVLLRGSPARRKKLLQEPADLYLINYELLPWLVEQNALKPYRSIVFDEVSMMKSPGIKRFRAIRN